MSRQHESTQGARDMLPMLLGAIPFGIIFGSLAGAAGLMPGKPWACPCWCSPVRRSYIAISLLAGGAGIAVVLLTTFVVHLPPCVVQRQLQPYVRHLPQALAHAVGLLAHR